MREAHVNIKVNCKTCDCIYKEMGGTCYRKEITVSQNGCKDFKGKEDKQDEGGTSYHSPITCYPR